MKRHLWLIGLILVVVAGLGFGYAGTSPSKVAWIASTVVMAIGGLAFIASYWTYRRAK